MSAPASKKVTTSKGTPSQVVNAMASLLERLLGDDTPDEQVDLEARQEEADDALDAAVERGGYDIEGCALTGVAVGPAEDAVRTGVVRVL
jgi:hypothetical protein